MFMTLNEVRSALLLPLSETDLPLTGISTDTRTIKPGDLFVALVGENFDGHEYVQRALALGAVAAVVQRPIDGSDGKILYVPSTLEAYGKIAGAWRHRFNIPVLAITGSVGKTTMKEMLGLTLSALGPVLKSERNENNEIGVPLTMLRLNDSHRSLVIEMGMRGFGQVQYLTGIVQPTIGIITMIGESHIEILGSREAIADAKGELLEGLGAESFAILNGDDPFYTRLLAKTSCRVRTFGVSETADVRVCESVKEGDGWRLSLSIDGESFELFIHSPAHHDVMNAAGAIAAAIAAGAAPRDAVKSMDSYLPSHMRMEVLTLSSGAIVLSDCYNAAPSSVKSALLTLSESKKGGIKSAFLGDMRELGSYSAAMHKDVADEALRLGIDHIYTIGESMGNAFPNALAHFSNSDEAAKYAAEKFDFKGDDIALVKGSRALELEKITESLVRL